MELKLEECYFYEKGHRLLKNAVSVSTKNICVILYLDTFSASLFELSLRYEQKKKSMNTEV